MSQQLELFGNYFVLIIKTESHLFLLCSSHKIIPYWGVLNICMVVLDINVDVCQEMDGASDDEDEERMPNGDLSRDLRNDEDDLRDPVNVSC